MKILDFINNIEYDQVDIDSYHMAGVVIKNSKKEILILQDNELTWGIPFLFFEPNENINAKIKQFLKNELSIDIINFKEFGNQKFEAMVDGNKVEVMGHLFEIYDFVGNINFINKEKFKRLDFFPVSHLISMKQKLNNINSITETYLRYIGYEINY